MKQGTRLYGIVHAMFRYRAQLVGVSHRWTGRGQRQEIEALTAVMTGGAQEPGWRFHSITPIPISSGDGKIRHTGLLIVWEWSQPEPQPEFAPPPMPT